MKDLINASKGLIALLVGILSLIVFPFALIAVATEPINTKCIKTIKERRIKRKEEQDKLVKQIVEEEQKGNTNV